MRDPDDGSIVAAEPGQRCSQWNTAKDPNKVIPGSEPNSDPVSALFDKAISRPHSTHGCAGSACLKRIEDRATDGKTLPFRQLLDRSAGEFVPKLSPYPWDASLCTL